MISVENTGTVYWLTGLSGAGKTTLGTRLFHKLKEQKENVVYLDGDILREVFGNILGHSTEDRKKLAGQYSRLCRMLSAQGHDVVCATVSMFDEVRNWNRAHIPSYKEIYIKVPIEELSRRDQKQLYSRALKGEVKNVMGMDVKVEEPKNPDYTLLNDGSQTIEEVFNTLIQKLF